MEFYLIVVSVLFTCCFGWLTCGYDLVGFCFDCLTLSLRLFLYLAGELFIFGLAGLFVARVLFTWLAFSVGLAQFWLGHCLLLPWLACIWLGSCVILVGCLKFNRGFFNFDTGIKFLVWLAYDWQGYFLCVPRSPSFSLDSFFIKSLVYFWFGCPTCSSCLF